MPDLLNVVDLVISLGNGPGLFEPMSFEILPGECLGLVGPSGSGKSLTALALLGLLGRQASVVAGHAAYRAKEGNGYNLFEIDAASMRQLRGREIAYVAQDCQSALNPVMTCGNQLREAVSRLQPGVKNVADEVGQQLRRVELGGIAERVIRSYPHELSGGQLQRVLIAMALAGRPRLLVADEPTTALDAVTEMEIMLLLDRLRMELGMGVLLITHDTKLLTRVTDRIVRLKPPSPAKETTRMASTPPSTIAPPSKEPYPLMVSGLSIAYGAGPKPIVDDISFRIEPGEYVALVGPSGCGKSTLARWLVGLVAASSGWVVTEKGGVSATASGGILRDHLQTQLVFQDILGSLNPSMSVSGSIDELCALHRYYRVADLFEAVGLDREQHGDRRPGELSGGQRQRVALMRALAAGPRFLVCDEAVTALDDALKLELQQLLRQTCIANGVGILFITHDLGEVINYADRVLVMSEGRIVEDLSPRRLIEGAGSETGRALVRAAGFGSGK